MHEKKKLAAFLQDELSFSLSSRGTVDYITALELDQINKSI
jgi:hypothetical protein